MNLFVLFVVFFPSSLLLLRSHVLPHLQLSSVVTLRSQEVSNVLQAGVKVEFKIRDLDPLFDTTQVFSSDLL